MTPSSLDQKLIAQAQQELDRDHPDAAAGDLREWNGFWWRYRDRRGVPSRGIPSGHVWEPVGSV